MDWNVESGRELLVDKRKYEGLCRQIYVTWWVRGICRICTLPGASSVPLALSLAVVSR